MFVVNGIVVIKFFLIGFDGVAFYMNIIQFIVEYNGFIEGGQAYFWQFLLSFGEVFFGKVVFLIGIVYFFFLFVLLVVFRLAWLLLNWSWFWLVVWLVVLNFSLSFYYFYDEKVDLGFIFIMLVVVFMLIEFWMWVVWLDVQYEFFVKLLFGFLVIQWMLLFIGWLLGFVFGIKYMGLFSIVVIFMVIGYWFGNYWLVMSLVIGFFGVLFLFGGNNFGYFFFGEIVFYVVGLIGIGVVVVLLVFVWMKGVNFKFLLMVYLFFGGVVLLCFVLWGICNMVVNGEVGVQAFLEVFFFIFVIKVQVQAFEVDYLERFMENIKKCIVGLDIQFFDV